MRYEIEKWFKFINWELSEQDLQNTLNFFSKERAPIRDRFENLSWYSKKSEQMEAINFLSINLLPCEYVFLILADQYSLTPYNEQEKYYKRQSGKERWENAAKTIIKIGWPKVDIILIPMFIWLLDPNWPGSKLIYDFLLSLPLDILQKRMKKIIESPQNYDPYVYEDLKNQIDDLCEDLKISI